MAGQMAFRQIDELGAERGEPGLHDGAAGQQARSGARAVGIVVGTRYIHTVTEMIDLGDLAAARDVLAAWIPTVR